MAEQAERVERVVSEAERIDRVVAAAIEQVEARRHLIACLSSRGEEEGFAEISAANRQLISAVEELLEFRRVQAEKA